MLEVFKPGALNCFTFFRPILSTSLISANPILTHLPLSGFLGSLLCVLIAPTPGLAFSSDSTHTSGGVVIFVRQGLSFSELSTSSLSSLDPYFDYVGINISLNNSSSLSFLKVYAALNCSSPKDGRTDSFSPSIIPFSRNLYILGDFNCHHSLWDSRGISNPAGRKYLTGSSPLTSSPLMTLTHPPFSIAPLLTSPLLPSLLPLLAPGRCYKAWALTTYQFFYPSLSLRSFALTSVPLPSIFRKLAGMTLSPTLTLTFPHQRNTRLFLFPMLLLSLPLWH